MKPYSVTALILTLLCSCSIIESEESIVKKIIADSSYGPLAITKMGEIGIIKDDVLILPATYLDIEQYPDISEEGDYKLVRYIFKTPEGAGRMFYLINLSNQEIVDRSSDPEAFYLPITDKIFRGMEVTDIVGDNLFELMRY